MPQTNNIITPVERLNIAAQILSGMHAALDPNDATCQQQDRMRIGAIKQADDLIKESGCIVEREYQDEEEDAVPCMHNRISKLDSTVSHCLDCGEEL